MRLTVQPGGEVILTAPPGTPSTAIDRFVRNHASWIERSVQRMRGFKPLPVRGRRDYLNYKEEARAFVHERLAHWNQFYRHRYERVAIKDTKRLWGSCSRKGNLNFSYALLFLPRELADYVVVHELCHLREHNHGPRFWALVTEAMPDFEERRAELRRYLPRT
jgi:predicted metal-dependent hydrolase